MTGWRRLSIVAKLPLGIFALLLVVMTALTVLMHGELERAALDVAAERLDGTAGLLADMLGGSATERTSTLRRLAAQANLAEYLQGDTSLRSSVLERLSAFSSSSTITASMEVWDTTGARLLGTDSTLMAIERPVAASLLARLGPGVVGGVGAFREIDESVTYPVVVGVEVGGRLAGAIVERRRLVPNQQGAELLSQLIGSEARLLVGNADGDFWTDLVGRVSGPPDAAGADTLLQYTTGEGERVLARIRGIPGTQWLLAMEFPVAPVLAQAHGSVRRGGYLGVILVLLGTAVAVVLSRRMTVPLNRVTEAAESVARGVDWVRVEAPREDEIGRLAGAFNTMIARVEESRLTLERRVAERTAALEAANAELESFSYSVSHDLRAPLRAVDGFSAVLEEDYASELTPEAGRYVRLIRSNAQQMGQLIDDLLTFSRLARQELSMAPIDMTELAHAVVVDICGSTSGNAAQVTVHQLPPALGERSMIRQVFANYVQNAVKFTRHRTPPRIEIGGEARDLEHVYYVRDNGVGFDMRYAGKLFGVFQRLHGPDEFEGTGVGLAIVQRIVHRHGGRVWAESEPERGATFWFSLPHVGESASPERAAENGEGSDDGGGQ